MSRLFGTATIQMPTGVTVKFGASVSAVDAQNAAIQAQHNWEAEPTIGADGYPINHAVTESFDLVVTIVPVGSTGTNTKAHALEGFVKLTPMMKVTIAGMPTLGVSGTTWDFNKTYNLVSAGAIEFDPKTNAASMQLTLKRWLVGDDTANDARVTLLATEITS